MIEVQVLESLRFKTICVDTGIFCNVRLKVGRISHVRMDASSFVTCGQMHPSPKRIKIAIP